MMSARMRVSGIVVDPDVTLLDSMGYYTATDMQIEYHTGNDLYARVRYNITDDGGSPPELAVVNPLVNAIKSIVMVTIMVMAVLGNSLVIASVFRFERLRIIANSFIVSLAFADMTVAVLVMPFSALQEIMGKWPFGRIYCDIFNANDVLFSTASLLHLCCISMDRYIAITDPFHYESKMTKRRVAIMLGLAWGASSLISHIPIHLGWYTTTEMRNQTQPGTEFEACEFIVNKVYCVISSSISFWIPTFIMVFVYVKIYREARKQEKQIHMLTKVSVPSLEHLNNNRAQQQQNGGTAGGNNGVHLAAPAPATTSRRKSSTGMSGGNSRLTQERKKFKREHKAAKTLGVIMGAFLCCWLPFFLWYVSSTMCGEACKTPDIVVSILFWIGYFNSALNPIIYACFNRDFRNAFKKLLYCHKLPSCCKKHGPEADSLARYGGAELQSRLTRTEQIEYPSSTSASPHARKHYDAVIKE